MKKERQSVEAREEEEEEEEGTGKDLAAAYVIIRRG